MGLRTGRHRVASQNRQKITDEASGVEGQERVFQRKGSLGSRTMDEHMEDCASSVGGVLPSRKRVRISSPTRNCTSDAEGKMLCTDASRRRVSFSSILEDTRAVSRRRPSWHNGTGTEVRSCMKKLPLAKRTDESGASDSSPNDSDDFNPVRSPCSMAGKRSDSGISNYIQIVEEGKDVSRGIDRSPGAIVEKDHVMLSSRDCLQTEGRIDSSQRDQRDLHRKLPAATGRQSANSDSSDRRGAQMTDLLMTTLSPKTVLHKNALATKVKRLRSSLQGSWGRKDGGETSMSSDDGFNVGNAPLLEKLGHLVECLGSSDHVSSCEDALSCSRFDGDPPDRKAKVKHLARKYQNVSSCRKSLTSEFGDDVDRVGTAAPEGEVNSIDWIIREISSFVKQRNSASNEDTGDGGTAVEKKAACVMKSSRHVYNRAKSLTEIPSASNDDAFDAGTASEGKIACATTPPNRVGGCAESLSKKRPVSANFFPIVPLTVNLGYRCDSKEFLRQQRAARSLQKEVDEERQRNTASNGMEDGGVLWETESPASSVPVEHANHDARIFSLDIVNKIDCLGLVLGKSFSVHIKQKSLLVGGGNAKKTGSSMIRRNYPKPNTRCACRCFRESSIPSPSHGESSGTLREQERDCAIPGSQCGSETSARLGNVTKKVIPEQELSVGCQCGVVSVRSDQVLKVEQMLTATQSLSRLDARP